MSTHVAFMRAINVAGHATVRMTDLRDAFASAGCNDVSTYIQSGNVIFESPEKNAHAVFQRIRSRLRKLLGDDPEILFRTVREIEGLVAAAPFKVFESEADIKLYVTFLSRKPQIEPKFPLGSSKEALEAIGMKNLDVFTVSRRRKSGFYGFPNNFIERELQVPATSRNWSTVSRIAELVRAAPAGKRC